jgi:hypothetical protein
MVPVVGLELHLDMVEDGSLTEGIGWHGVAAIVSMDLVQDPGVLLITKVIKVQRL